MSGDFAAQPGRSLEDAGQPGQAIGKITVIARTLFLRKHSAGKPTVVGWNKLLDDAEFLLDYACQSGIDLDPATVQTIISAGARDELSDEDAVKAIAAITTLAAKLRPVTAETLRACRDKAPLMIHRYWIRTTVLGVFLLLSSVLSFITTGLSNSLTADITLANQLAVTLNSDIAAPSAAAPQANAGPNTDSKDLSTLQQFAATIREVYGLSHQLRYFVLAPDTNQIDEKDMEITVPAVITDEVEKKIPIYQSVRYFAKDMQERTTLFYGALSNFLLPPLYAILGACAYLLRSFSDQIKGRTFAPSVAASARFIIAAIGGGVVGLFSDFTLGQGTSLSPLAIAFVVGYATDIFFSFLDGLQTAFTKAKPS